MGGLRDLFKRKIRTRLDLLSIPQSGGKNVKTFIRWAHRLQIQMLDGEGTFDSLTKRLRQAFLQFFENLEDKRCPENLNDRVYCILYCR